MGDVEDYLLPPAKQAKEKTRGKNNIIVEYDPVTLRSDVPENVALSISEQLILVR